MKSDPFISSIRNQWKVEHRDLDEEAKKLLKNRNSTAQNMEYLSLMNNNYNCLSLLFKYEKHSFSKK